MHPLTFVILLLLSLYILQSTPLFIQHTAGTTTTSGTATSGTSTSGTATSGGATTSGGTTTTSGGTTATSGTSTTGTATSGTSTSGGTTTTSGGATSGTSTTGTATSGTTTATSGGATTPAGTTTSGGTTATSGTSTSGTATSGGATRPTGTTTTSGGTTATSGTSTSGTATSGAGTTDRPTTTTTTTTTTTSVADGTELQLLDIGIVNASGELSTISSKDITIPTGTMVIWMSPTIPTGWLLCDGRTIQRTSYPALVNVLAGAVALTATLPDTRDYAIAGSSSTLLIGTTTGASHGSILVPEHSHGIQNTPSFTYGGSNIQMKGIDTTRASICTVDKGNGPINRILLSTTTGAWGNSQSSPVSIVQPSIVVNYIIKT